VQGCWSDFWSRFFERALFPSPARSVSISTSVSRAERAAGFPLPLTLSRSASQLVFSRPRSPCKIFRPALLPFRVCCRIPVPLGFRSTGFFRARDLVPAEHSEQEARRAGVRSWRRFFFPAHFGLLLCGCLRSWRSSARRWTSISLCAAASFSFFLTPVARAQVSGFC
jgi:hypothetical protein